MKITIAPVLAGTPPTWDTEVVLVAGQDASPENIIVSSASVGEMVQILGNTGQTAIDRGNEANTITFQRTDPKSTFALSEDDLIKYKSTLPRFGLFRFYDEGALSGTPFAFMVGYISAFNHSQIGVTTIRGFTLTGGAILTTQPDPPIPYG